MTRDFVYIRELSEHVGERVVLKGWVYQRRSSGKIRFLVLRDGSGYLQCVAFVKDVSPEVFEACDRALRATAEHLEPELAIGVGAFAEKRIRHALDGFDLKSGRILHPSPASPLANRGWAAQAERQLVDLGVRF